MVVARREGDERIARLLRGYPHRAVTVPFAGKNILGKPGKEVSRQRSALSGICRRKVSCSVRGVRKSNSPLTPPDSAAPLTHCAGKLRTAYIAVGTGE